MSISSDKLPETFKIYRADATKYPVNLLGEAAPQNPSNSNMIEVGTVKGRINLGDSLEPDILGPVKDYSVDVSSMWIVWFAIPDGFEIYEGDMVESTTDSTRLFQIQFLDRYPGGVSGHHYEGRLQTTSILRNQ